MCVCVRQINVRSGKRFAMKSKIVFANLIISGKIKSVVPPEFVILENVFFAIIIPLPDKLKLRDTHIIIIIIYLSGVDFEHVVE